MTELRSLSSRHVESKLYSGVEVACIAESILDWFRDQLPVDPFTDTRSMAVVAEAIVVQGEKDYRIPASLVSLGEYMGGRKE